MSVILNDDKLSLQDYIDVSLNHRKVEISDGCVNKINNARKTVESIVENDKIVYGVTTGFGSLRNKFINKEDVVTLQKNLIRSHAIGSGNSTPEFIVRGMLLHRLRCICNGNSGVRLEVANILVEALNKNFIPFIPERGTVGASGDLAPLSFMVLSLMGEGLAYDNDSKTFIDSTKVLEKLEIKPIVLLEKEGLALNNGTQFITAWSAFALYYALINLNNANKISAVTIEALRGTHKQFDERIHQCRPHLGQIKVAKQLRKLLEDSKINETYSKDKVQDAYSLRCIPQIHGPVYDKLLFCLEIINTEINSSNDNPLIFGEDVVSGGNFHGMYLGMVADDIAYCMTVLANVSERRLERLVNSDLNGFLPAFLVKDAGLNSGFMIVQYAAAADVAECRQLSNPASVHTIPTCQGTEDVVSMAGWASRKAFISTTLAKNVLAYELFAACQALDYTLTDTIKSSDKVMELYNKVRKVVPFIEKDMYMNDYIKHIRDLL